MPKHRTTATANVCSDDAAIRPREPGGRLWWRGRLRRASIFALRSAIQCEEIAGALRGLVAAVVVHPAGRDEPRVEVTGPLAQLTGAPELFLQQDISAPRTLVAGSGIEPPTYGL